MVEFAIVLPLMLVLMAIAADFGRLFYAYVAVQNAAKEGALYGSRTPLCVTDVGCPDPNNVQWHVQNEASNLVSGGTSLLKPTTTCRGPGSDGPLTLRAPINDCVPGDTYIVSVSYDFQLITPILGSVLGSGLTLTATHEAAVIGSAYDPSGIEALIWANTSNSDNAAAITAGPTMCTPADPGFSLGFYYAPCQDQSNTPEYLLFQEGKTITFKVRIKNTGNINMTNLTYNYAVNGVPLATPTCSPSGSLATSLAKNAGPSYCTFTLPATATGGTVNDMNVSIVAQGLASGVPTGQTSGGATVKVMPSPRLAVTLKAAPYRLGDDGDGINGTLSYTYPSPLTLQRQATSADPTIKSPKGWLYLNVTNTGGAANNFTLGVTSTGPAIDLTALGCPSIPGALGAGGGSGSTYTCVFPQTFEGSAANYDFTPSVSATNAVVTGVGTFRVTTADCAVSSRVVPNLVDKLLPTPDNTNKIVSEAQSSWTSAGLTGTLTSNPSVATNYVLRQTVRAYTCVAPNTTATITTQVGPP
jgi:hypothetical protein